jgi:hypothetical protein
MRSPSNATYADARQWSDAYGKLPASFESNRGQINDARVKFLAHASGYNLFLTPTDIVFASHALVDPRNAEQSSAHGVPSLRMKLIGANPQPDIEGLEELPGKVNYFKGSDPARWRANVPTYAKVKYSRVYEGVDAIYYGTQNSWNTISSLRRTQTRAISNLESTEPNASNSMTRATYCCTP